MPDPFYSFVLFVIAATFSPGGATTLATASGVQFGYFRSLSLLIGMMAGMALLSASAVLGLSSLIRQVPLLETAMLVAGTAYLLWLAYRLFGAGPPGQSAGGRQRPIGFSGGLALLLLNPKAWAMTLGAAASFGAISPHPRVLAATMAATFFVVGLTSLSLWCVGGSYLSRALKSEGQWRLVNRTLGALLALSIVPVWL